MKLIMYLGTPLGHDKFEETVTLMRYTLFSAVSKGLDEVYVQKVMQDIIVVTGIWIEFLAFDMEFLVDDMLLLA